MARYNSIAGYFTKVVEQQPVKIRRNFHAVDENGVPQFKEDMTTPIIEERELDAMVDVENIVWVDQVNVPFTEEEEREADARDAAASAAAQNEKVIRLEQSKMAFTNDATLYYSQKILMGLSDNVDELKKQYRDLLDVISKVTSEEELSSLQLK